MHKLETPYGVIYIEDWEYDRHIPGKRDVKDIIKLYDSDERFLDYWTIEAVLELANENEMSGKEYYDYWTNNIKSGFINSCIDINGNIESFAYHLGLELMKVSENINDIQKALEEAIGHSCSLEETKNSDYVNHIGKYYILLDKFWC